MAISKLLSIAYRNLVRNGRRTALTALAVGLGLVVNMAFASLIDGMVTTMVADGIRIDTGHLQIRNANFEPDKRSLLAKNLLQDSEGWAARAEAVPEVRSAAPVLWGSGLLNAPQESVGVEIVGIDTEDRFHDPVRAGLMAGEYLQNDDRGRILIGSRLADQMGISVGQRVGVAATDADGRSQEGIFTVAGLVDTGFAGIDNGRIFLPLAQAQSFLGVGDRFSSLILMLNDEEDTAAAGAALTASGNQLLTWKEMNKFMTETIETAMPIYYVLYGIVFVAVAILIANTLLMSVFSRAREIGILSSIGMNGRNIMMLFLLEGILLALFGIGMGLTLGLGIVSYMTFVGLPIPAETTELVDGLAFGTTIYGGFAPGQFALLAVMLLAIVSLVSLYPAIYAARMEPVEALHSV